MSKHPINKLAPLIEERLRTAGPQGRTQLELCITLPGHTTGYVSSTLSKMRDAGLMFTLRQGSVALNFCRHISPLAAREALVQRAPLLQSEISARMSKGRAAGGASQRKDQREATQPDRAKREQHRANVTASAIKGDGTYQPARPPKPPPTVEAVDPSKVQHCTGWKPRWAVTEPITSLPIGQYDTPPSPWATAATAARATT